MIICYPSMALQLPVLVGHETDEHNLCQNLKFGKQTGNKPVPTSWIVLRPTFLKNGQQSKRKVEVELSIDKGHPRCGFSFKIAEVSLKMYFYFRIGYRKFVIAKLSQIIQFCSNKSTCRKMLENRNSIF